MTPSNETQIRQTIAEAREDSEKRFELSPMTSVDSFCKIEFPPDRFIVDRLIVKNGINLITGNASVGKTWVTLEFAIKISQGLPVFGKYEVKESKRVLVVNEEDDAASLQDRIKLMTDKRAIPIFLHVQSGIRLDDEEIVRQLLDQSVLNGIEVIVLDNLQQLHTLNENASDQMQKIVNQIKKFTKNGITVILIHHHRKEYDKSPSDAGSMVRGSSAIHGCLHSHLGLRLIPDPIDHKIEIEQTKNKAGRRITELMNIILKVEEKRIYFEYAGETTKEVSAEMKLVDDIYRLISTQPENIYLDTTQIISYIKKDERSVKNALRTLKDHKKIKSDTKKNIGINNGGSRSMHVYWATTKEERQGDIFAGDGLDSTPF